MEYYVAIKNVDGGLYEQSYNITDDINPGSALPITEPMPWLAQEEDKCSICLWMKF